MAYRLNDYCFSSFIDVSTFKFQIQFREKVLWTAITLFIFLVCCQVSNGNLFRFKMVEVRHGTILNRSLCNRVFTLPVVVVRIPHLSCFSSFASFSIFMNRYCKLLLVFVDSSIRNHVFGLGGSFLLDESHLSFQQR